MKSNPSDLIARYRKPLIGAAAAIVLYALLGFFAVPWLIGKTAVDYVDETYGARLAIENVAVNPFAMSLAVEGLELDTPDADPFLRFDRFFVNFQSSSLFRWAFTFREVHLDGLEVFMSRDGRGELNAAFLTRPATTAAEEAPPGDDSGPARLLIRDFAIRDSVVHWNDEVPPEPVDTEFGPINIAIAELNTLPDRAGMQDVVITTETQGTLSWNGSLELNPLRSAGSASVRGSHFPLTSAYLKHEVGFDVVGGLADVDLDYRVDTLADGTLEFSIENFNLAFSDLIVRTFNEAVGRDGEDREVLRLSRIGLSGGEMHWPSQTVSAELLSVDDADVRLYRDAAGALNVLPPAGNEAEPVPAPAPAQEPGEPWQISLGQFSLNGMTLGLQDDSVTPAADIGWESLDVEIRDISNADGASFPTTLQLTARDGGTVAAEGTLAVLPQPVVDFDLSIAGLALAGAHPYLKPLADVNLDSGVLNVAAKLGSSPEDPFRLAGDVEIADFLITETDEGSRLGSWRSLEAENLVFSTGGHRLDVSELRLTEPYGDILIAADGSINLGRVQKNGGSEDEAVEPEPAGTTEPEAKPLAVTIGRVTIADMSADFADLSLPLPFSARIAGMNGELTTISTESAEPSTVTLEGKVDEFGLVQVGGSIAPLDPPANTDIRVAFQNVDMPKFSAYSIPFAGREIASGRLDLDLGYKITDGQLAGANKIVLRDFELGEEVEHPDAMSLPLGLAVALLKDPEGKIDIDLPVEGNLDDPEFRIGGVVLKALGNLVTRIVTSPFALLANLVGVEADELEFIVFEPGRSDLSPPELEKASKIAEALSLRPELALQVGGAYVEAADGEALRTAAFDALVEERIAALDNDAMYAENRQAVIEALFTESGIAADPAGALGELQAAHTAPETDQGGGGFDALAYTEALREQLIEAQPLAGSALAELAGSRAANVKQAIADLQPALSARVVVDAATEAVEADEGVVPMRVRLTTGKEVGVQAVPQDVGAAEPMAFRCDEGGPSISVTFEGPETISLDNGETTRILQHVVSASGARYAAEGVEFWNKGDEAMLTDGEARYTCRRVAQ